MYVSRGMGFPTMLYWYVQSAKPQINLRIRAVWAEHLLVAWIFYECFFFIFFFSKIFYLKSWQELTIDHPISLTPLSVKLLTKHNLKFLSLKGGCTSSSVCTLVKMPHCWKSHMSRLMYCSHFRRTGRNVRAGKNIRIKEDGFEDFDDYMSESGNPYFLHIYHVYRIL